jgi:rhodanese-related sulfurtransferase
VGQRYFDSHCRPSAFRLFLFLQKDVFMKFVSGIFAFVLFIVVFACQGGGSDKQTTDGGAAVESSPSHPQASSNVKQLTVSQFEKMRRVGVQMNVIDVRTPEEIAKGKIPGAVEMDYEGGDFEEGLDGLQKELSYIIYCRTGRRSSEAAELMVQKGFRSVYNLEGGYEAWVLEDSK